MKNLDTVVFSCRHGYRAGDVYSSLGAPGVVRAVISDTVVLVEPFGFMRRVWWRLGGFFNLRGFWARVWSR